MLAAESNLYRLPDKELALEHVGHKVTVTGTLSEDTLKPTSIEKAKEDA